MEARRKAADGLGAAEVRQEGDVGAVQRDGAGIGDKGARDGVEQGGLARAVGAHNGGKIPLIQVQIDVGEGFFLIDRSGVEGHAHMVQLKHGPAPFPAGPLCGGGTWSDSF